MQEPTIAIRISHKLGLFLRGKMVLDDEGKPKETYDGVIKRLTGFNEE